MGNWIAYLEADFHVQSTKPLEQALNNFNPRSSKDIEFDVYEGAHGSYIKVTYCDVTPAWARAANRKLQRELNEVFKQYGKWEITDLISDSPEVKPAKPAKSKPKSKEGLASIIKFPGAEPESEESEEESDDDKPAGWNWRRFNPAEKWAYHGTSIAHGYTSKILNALKQKLPTEIGKYHFTNIATKGLVPKKSTRQLLKYRKALLGKRWQESFTYFNTQPLDMPTLRGLVLRYGDGLVIKNGGMLLRFPQPEKSELDPDASSNNVWMASSAIKPSLLQVFIPPKKYFQILGGKGNQTWSPWDLAILYLLQSRALENPANWKPIQQNPNPWINQVNLWQGAI